MERRIFNPETAPVWNPQKEWVQLTSGDWICVWQLSVSESLRIMECSQRHPEDPRPGNNDTEAAIWLLALACRAGEESNAARIWNDMQVTKTLQLAPADFGALTEAARRLMAVTKEVAQAQEDFTPPGAAEWPPSSLTGVSSISTGSRAS